MNDDSVLTNGAVSDRSPVHGNGFPAFSLQIKGVSAKTLEEVCLTATDPNAMIRVGRSHQPETFWRSLAPDACPAISREHFTVSAVLGDKGGYRFTLTCNSLNGLGVMPPMTANPVFLQKDNNSSIEIVDGTEIELAGVIRFTFRDTLNTGSTVAGSTSSGTRSINLVPAAVLRPPVHFGKVTSSASASFIGSADEDDPDDAFSKTGFKRGAAA
jgi:hypothetical protein